MAHFLTVPILLTTVSLLMYLYFIYISLFSFSHSQPLSLDETFPDLVEMRIIFEITHDDDDDDDDERTSPSVTFSQLHNNSLAISIISSNFSQRKKTVTF